MHFAYSATIMNILRTCCVPVLIAAGVTLLIGISKEIYDSTQPGNKFDWDDLMADILGILVSII